MNSPKRRRGFLNRPRLGWIDCKIHLFHAKHATPEQRDALSKFEGIRINKSGGVAQLLEAVEIARRLGLGQHIDVDKVADHSTKEID